MTEREEPKKPAAPRWAADEPTAMWDEGALAEQGLEAPRPKPTAAREPARAPARGLSWPFTIGIAISVAVAVFFLVRTLRG